MPRSRGDKEYILPVKGINTEEVRQTLLKNYDTGVMAIGELIRVAYSSLSSDLIELLFENINNACSDVKNRKTT